MALGSLKYSEAGLVLWENTRESDLRVCGKSKRCE